MSFNRLSKVISSTGLCSRREAEKWIAEGRVSLNGAIQKSVMVSISELDEVRIDGAKIRKGVCTVKPRIWAVHKIRGELVSSDDPIKNRPLIFKRLAQFFPEGEKLFPVYRLEFNTEGLQLLTNNGELARFLVNPSNGCKTVYKAKLHGKMTESKLEGFHRGPVINGIKYRPMEVKVENSSGTINWATITVSDNHSRAVKNVCDHLNLQLARLICIRYGPYSAQGLDTNPHDAIKELKIAPDLHANFTKFMLGKSSYL